MWTGTLSSVSNHHKERCQVGDRYGEPETKICGDETCMYLADSDSDAELGPQDEEGAGHDGRRELAPSEHTLNEGACGWVDRERQVWAQTGGGGFKSREHKTHGRHGRV